MLVMRVSALFLVFGLGVTAIELRPQFPGMQFPGMGVPFPGMQFPAMGGLPFPSQQGLPQGLPQGFPQGIPQGMGFPQMNMPMGMGGLPGFGFPQFPQGAFNIPNTQVNAPAVQQVVAQPATPVQAVAAEQPVAVAPVAEAPAVAAPAAAPAAAAVPATPAVAPETPAVVPAIAVDTTSSQQVVGNKQQQVMEMAKWAELMGMPKLSEADLSKMLDMQGSMVAKLKSLSPNDVNLMRTQQNALAEKMDQILRTPENANIDTFQSEQETLMNEWASKLGLPTITPEEHQMMHSQIKKMFDQLSHLPSSELEQLTQKHNQVKNLMQQLH
eukprot:c11108_g1_i1.p1 GENE.c11108_g1_i1~~c11108_g1_i1.p1  ORF type:complete len:327 (-),score=96.89 c11108_g1_i1:558-1538(-)